MFVVVYLYFFFVLFLSFCCCLFLLFCFCLFVSLVSFVAVFKNVFSILAKCVTEDGGVYYDGDSWFPDPEEPCYVCICDHGTIDCFEDEECKTGKIFSDNFRC